MKNRIMIKDTEKKVCNNIISGGRYGNQLFCGHPAGSRHCECRGPADCTQFSLDVLLDVSSDEKKEVRYEHP